MGEGRAAKRVAAVAAVVGAMGAFGVAPAQAGPGPCDQPAGEPICEMVYRQVANVQTEAEAATDYVLYWGDVAVETANTAYYAVRCYMLGECS